MLGPFHNDSSDVKVLNLFLKIPYKKKKEKERRLDKIAGCFPQLSSLKLPCQCRVFFFHRFLSKPIHSAADKRQIIFQQLNQHSISRKTIEMSDEQLRSIKSYDA